METTPQLRLPLAPALGASLLETLVEPHLHALRDGELELVDGARVRRFGAPASDGLRARVTVLRPDLWRRLALGGALGAAEAYMEGDWTSDDPTAVLRLFARNAGALAALETGLARAGQAAAAWLHAARRNTRAGSRRNIAEHYDLGNDFFARMLDPTMTYSAAVFEPADATLEQASVRKLDRLCRALELGPDDHLLELGTGWGSMALHAAGRYGCRVTTTTVSRAQATLARERIAAAGLAGRITLLERDYRDVEGVYSKLVSVEMIEAVGHAFYDTFFRVCAERLAPGGRLALQAITIADQQYDRARREVDFIKRYTFPGSNIPSVTALLQAATRASDLVVRGLDDITPHYARTLAAWRSNLAPHRAEVVARYGERFWRMWALYLAYCEAGFTERWIGTVQMVFDRPRRVS